MKYIDLINYETCAKLMMVSFSTPKKNLQIYKFSNFVLDCQKFFDNEKNKLIEQYGEIRDDGTYRISGDDKIKKYKDGISDILSLDIPDGIIIPDITEEDFADDSCEYSKDKRFWLNGNEISKFLAFLDKARNEI